jgi:Flp pilus assembly protein TadD
MHPRLQRALILLGQSRYELAEQELRQTLSEIPNEAVAHAVLGICLVHRQQFEEASQEVETAIHLAPEEPFGFYAQSIVYHHRNRYLEAETAIRHAIELNPYRSDFFAQLSQLHFDQGRWQQTMDTAEEGLALDPEDTACINLRAMSLVKLGRKIDAGDALATALEHAPEDAYSHANLGWTRVEQGQYEKAMEHFREALRLNPDLEWARLGIVEAMKARYVIYRFILNWFLWMMKLSGRARWWVIIGAYVAFQIVRQTASANPEWSPYLTPLLVLYVVFAVMTWIASPLFNLTLRLNRFGRLALSAEQIATSNWIGLCVLTVGICVVCYMVSGHGYCVPAAAVTGLLIPTFAGIYSCEVGWPRTAAVCMLGGLHLVGGLTLALFSAGILLRGEFGDALSGLGIISLTFFAVGAVASQFAIHYLMNQRPRR